MLIRSKVGSGLSVRLLWARYRNTSGERVQCVTSRQEAYGAGSEPG